MGFPLGGIFDKSVEGQLGHLVQQLIQVLDRLSSSCEIRVTPWQFIRENETFCMCVAEIRKNIYMIENTHEIEAILQAICLERIHRGITVFTLNQIPDDFFCGRDAAEEYMGVQMNILSLSGINEADEEYKIARHEILQSADMLHIIPSAYWSFMHNPDRSAVCPRVCKVGREMRYGIDSQMPVVITEDGPVLILD